jgi:hypothetical protein
MHAYMCVSIGISMYLLLFQGVYVLQDNKFRLLTQMSNGKQYMESSPKVRTPQPHQL